MDGRICRRTILSIEDSEQHTQQRFCTIQSQTISDMLSNVFGMATPQKIDLHIMQPLDLADGDIPVESMGNVSSTARLIE